MPHHQPDAHTARILGLHQRSASWPRTASIANFQESTGFAAFAAWGGRKQLHFCHWQWLPRWPFKPSIRRCWQSTSLFRRAKRSLQRSKRKHRHCKWWEDRKGRESRFLCFRHRQDLSCFVGLCKRAGICLQQQTAAYFVASTRKEARNITAASRCPSCWVMFHPIHKAICRGPTTSFTTVVRRSLSKYRVIGNTQTTKPSS